MILILNIIGQIRKKIQNNVKINVLLLLTLERKMNDNKNLGPLAGSVDVIKLCSQDKVYTGTIDKSYFQRLAQSTNALISDVEYQLHFYQDMQGVHIIEGESKVVVELICQRCSMPYQSTLCANILASYDEDKLKSLKLEQKYDIFELDEYSHFDVYEYLEDCLLLEIPIIPRHELEKDCLLQGSSWSFGQTVVEDSDNPFAALKDLIK